MPWSHSESECRQSRREDIFKEIDILVRLAHENVVYLKEYFHEINKVRASAITVLMLNIAAMLRWHV